MVKIIRVPDTIINSMGLFFVVLIERMPNNEYVGSLHICQVLL